MQYHSNSTDPKMEFNAILRSLVIALKANVFAGGGGNAFANKKYKLRPVMESNPRQGNCSSRSWITAEILWAFSILHSDNGTEFVISVIKDILESRQGQVQTVSERPHHPQSQGVVKQEPYTLKRMLSSKITEHKTCQPPWSSWLPHIVCKSNMMRSLYTDCLICVFKLS